MNPRKARMILLMIVIALLLLLLTYVFLLEPLGLPMVKALFLLAVIALLVAFHIILNRYYRCKKCGRRLTVGKTIFFGTKCPHCNAEIE